MSRLAVVTAAASAIAMAVAAAVSLPLISLAASIVFAALVIALALMANHRTASARRLAPAGEKPTIAALSDLAAQNAGWFALVFGWGAAAIVTGYGLTALYWQHWWQYGAGFAILTGIALMVRRTLVTQAEPHDLEAAAVREKRLSHLALLTAVQGFAAGVGVIFLFASGKLLAGKPDWLANHVFLAGGLAICLISATAFQAHRRLARAPR